MPSNAAGLGWASFIAGLGQQVPDMLRNYNKDVEAENAWARKRSNEIAVKKIMGGVPQIGAPMEPGQAAEVWQKASPEDKAQAAQILSSRGALPQGFYPQQDPRMYPGALPKVPDMSNVGGSALSALANPAAATAQPEAIDGILSVIGKKEGGGQYDAQHPRAANGLQAVGKYGIVPSVWFKAFPQYGLDSNKAEDIARFQATPALQEAMGRDVVKQLWEQAKGDPRRFAALYYSGNDSLIGTPNEWKPQFAYQKEAGRAVRKKVQMPSIGEYADSFAKMLKEAGVDPELAAPASGAGGAPYDNAALMDLIKDKPKLGKMPRRVGFQDQERYLMENVKNPEQLASLKDYMANITKLADRERDREKEDRTEFGKDKDDYSRNVVEASKQALEVWKTKYNAANARKTGAGKAKDEHRMYMKDLAGRMQQRLKDIGGWQLNFLKADDEQQELLKTQFPEFFTLKSKTSFFGGTKQEPDLDVNKVEKEMLRLRSQINEVEKELAPRGGVDFIEGDAGGEQAPQNFFIK